MNRAIKLPQYSDVKSFSPFEGVTIARIDKATNLLTDSSCSSNTFYAAFLDGTAPVNTCSQMSESPQNFIQKLFGIGGHSTPQPNQPAATPPATPPNTPPEGTPAEPTQPSPTKKKNIFQKIFGGGNDKNKQQPQPTQPPPQ
jgi:penicillin-binding protein 1B